MKKTFLSMMLILALAMPLSAFAAEVDASGRAANPVDLFTGKYWVSSTQDNKRAYLFGLDSAIAVEAVIARLEADRAKNGREAAAGPTVFVRNWMEAFKTTSRDELVTLINDWYDSHPNQLERPVMDVIWYEIIMPRVRAMQR